MPVPRVGLLGGTFDPPHVGHLVVAAEVGEALALDSVRLVVANDPWQKSAERRITPVGTRFRLTMAAAATPDWESPGRNSPAVEAADVEIRLGGRTTTARTLGHLRRDEPDVDFVVILGVDAALRVPTWWDAGECLRGVTVALVDRPGAPAADIPGVIDRAQRIEATQLDISSTAIRRRVADGLSIRHLVPPEVERLIETEGLYRRDSD